MSEYQYYEFQTIDQPLTDRQMRELRWISTRATISRTRFSNYYTYGDLKASPRDLLAQYFDVSLYFAHWHVVELAFRFPKNAVDLKMLRHYRAGQSLDVRVAGSNAVITICAEREDFDAEDDGRGWLPSLIPGVAARRATRRDRREEHRTVASRRSRNALARARSLRRHRGP